MKDKREVRTCEGEVTSRKKLGNNNIFSKAYF